MLEHRYSIKSDVWSFGLLLYELLHGDIPLGKCKSLEELRKTVFKPIEYNKNLSSDLKQFL